MGLSLEEQLQDCTLLPSSVPVRSQPMENSPLLRFQGVWEEMAKENLVFHGDKKLPKSILTIILICVMPYSHLHGQLTEVGSNPQCYKQGWRSVPSGKQMVPTSRATKYFHLSHSHKDPTRKSHHGEEVMDKEK